MIKPSVDYERRKIYKQEQVDWPRGTPSDIIAYMRKLESDYCQWNDISIEEEWSDYTKAWWWDGVLDGEWCTKFGNCEELIGWKIVVED
jgi:hypothetical protein